MFLNSLLGIIVVILIVAIGQRFALERRPVTQQEPQCLFKARHTALGPIRHQFANTLQQKSAALDRNVDVALNVDRRCGRVRILLWERERGANEQRAVERDRTCTTRDVDLCITCC